MADAMFVGAWYRWFPDDWQGSRKVRRMTAAERGVYHELLDLEWLEGPFLFVPDELARLTGLTANEIDSSWPRVRACFSCASDGRWSNEKLEAERVLAKGRSERARTGAERRWSPESDALRNANGIDQALRSASPEHAPSICLGDAAQGSGLRAQGTTSQNSETQKPALFGAEAAPPQRRTKPKPKPNPVNVAFADWWETRWVETRGSEWRWTAKERAAVNAIRGHAQDDLGAMQARAENLLASQDAWVAQNAAPSLLSSRWNQFAALVQKLPPSKSQRLLADIASRMENRNGAP